MKRSGNGGMREVISPGRRRIHERIRTRGTNSRSLIFRLRAYRFRGPTFDLGSPSPHIHAGER